MDTIQQKYKKKIRVSTRTSDRLCRELKELKDKLESMITKGIIEFNSGKHLPSAVSNRVLHKHRLVLEANKDLYSSTQVYLAVKERASISISIASVEKHNDMRLIRDNLKTQFMTDLDVTETIKTIKHQEAAFGILFGDMLDNYSRGKIYYQNIQELMSFISDGLYQLSNLGRYVYNYSQMENQTMNAEEQSVSSSILYGGGGRSKDKTISEDGVLGTKRKKKRRFSKPQKKD